MNQLLSHTKFKSKIVLFAALEMNGIKTKKALNVKIEIGGNYVNVREKPLK